MEAETAYLLRRAREEREAATKAAHPAARQAHLELAQRYEEMASSIAAHEKRLGIGNTGTEASL